MKLAKQKARQRRLNLKSETVAKYPNRITDSENFEFLLSKFRILTVNLSKIEVSESNKSISQQFQSRKGKDGKTREQRKVKRCSGRGYRSARVRLAKECQTLRELEIGFLHWLTAKIIKDHPNLVVELLQILNIVEEP